MARSAMVPLSEVREVSTRGVSPVTVTVAVWPASGILRDRLIFDPTVTMMSV
ncbi:MAG: hypothetical protein HYR58_02605 [Acidobacteria bacterium]|nr:hypothetical protein [Acidobacteriota bacterium]